jgi:hypothetical protein
VYGRPLFVIFYSFLPHSLSVYFCISNSVSLPTINKPLLPAGHCLRLQVQENVVEHVVHDMYTCHVRMSKPTGVQDRLRHWNIKGYLSSSVPRPRLVHYSMVMRLPDKYFRLRNRYVGVEGAHFGRPAITADKVGNAYIVGFLVSNLSRRFNQSAAYVSIKKGKGGAGVPC